MARSRWRKDETAFPRPTTAKCTEAISTSSPQPASSGTWSRRSQDRNSRRRIVDEVPVVNVIGIRRCCVGSDGGNGGRRHRRNTGHDDSSLCLDLPGALSPGGGFASSASWPRSDDILLRQRKCRFVSLLNKRSPLRFGQPLAQTCPWAQRLKTSSVNQDQLRTSRPEAGDLSLIKKPFAEGWLGEANRTRQAHRMCGCPQGESQGAARWK